MPNKRIPNKPKAPILHHLPPQSLEAEESLISAILLDSDSFLEIIEILSHDDFLLQAHQIIFEVIETYFPEMSLSIW